MYFLTQTQFVIQKKGLMLLLGLNVQSLDFPWVEYFPLSDEHWYISTNITALRIYIFQDWWVPLTVLPLYVTVCVDKMIAQPGLDPVWQCVMQERWLFGMLVVFSHVRALFWGLIVHLLSHYRTLFLLGCQQVDLIGSQSWYLINKSFVCVICFSCWEKTLLCFLFPPYLSQLDYASNCTDYFLNQKILSACCFYSWLFLEILWAVMQFWCRCGNGNVLQ